MGLRAYAAVPDVDRRPPSGPFRLPSRPSLVAALLCLVASIALLAGVPPARAVAACTSFASPAGSDVGSGTEAQPYLTAQRLVRSLHAGETGCLRAGTYSDNVTVARGGAAGAPITLTSYPGERATIAGKLWIMDTADFVTVSSLNLDGRNPGGFPSPIVNGDDVTFSDDDVTNYHTSICFDLGATIYGRAYRTVIQRSRVHDCGQLPATNFDHGIYVEHASGATIVDNQIYDNADRGVQLYPDAQATYLARNVIDGNGEGVLIAGGSEDYGSQASNDNVVEQNLITNSNQRNNLESRWDPGLVGQRNIVRNNCIYGGALDPSNHGLAADYGFTSSGNVMDDPRYVDRAGNDFRLRPDSGCLRLTGAGAATPAAADPVPRIVVSASTTATSPGGAFVLSGQVEGRRPPTCVVLKARRGKRWKRVARVRVRRDGRFSTRLRLRHRHHRRASAGRRCLRLRSAALTSFGRAVKLTAFAPGFRRSNTVRVRVRRR